MAQSPTVLRRSTRLQSERNRYNCSSGSDSESDIYNSNERKCRPTELYTEDQISGKKLCPIQTPGRKNAIKKKAQEYRTLVIQTPKVSGRCSSSHDSESSSESVSYDEYKPGDSDEISEEDDANEDDSVSESNESEETDTDYKKRSKSIKTPNSKSVRKSVRQHSDETETPTAHHFKAEEYFESQSQKILTSNRTLARLKNPRLNVEKIQKLLANKNHLSKEHIACIGQLNDSCRNMFLMWQFILEENFSLLLYGVGSKRNLINEFYEEMVSEHPAVFVNGFFPSLTLKNILDAVIVNLLELDSIPNHDECFKVINSTLRNNPGSRLYLIIHNIDGPQLRAHKVQDLLSQLATIPNLHLIASVDHINVSTLWDNVKRSRFNFFWWDATTFMPYEEEVKYESSLLVNNSGTLALSSMRSVFQSLTPNARKIYIMLIKYQIENSQNTNFYPGMAFKDLYRMAREAFVVSTDSALRTQLTEFIDHQLVKLKRNNDGVEYLIIPLNLELLKQFLEQQEET